MSTIPKSVPFAFVVVLLLTASFCDHAAWARSDPAVDYDRDVRPILADKCFACHGHDADNQESGFRLDSEENAFADLGGYRAIEPGDLLNSELVRRISSSDPDQVMPPADYFKSLNDSEQQTIRQWVAGGAVWSQPWAFVPPLKTEPPQVDLSRWPLGMIDQFVLRSLEEQGLQPAPAADSHQLLRRLTFDLTGLPPNELQRERYRNLHQPEEYERLVDELLASPRYGERMAVYWLDLVRYADSVGYHGDQSVSVSPYRDYVIDAFNNNMPFDRFTLEQLAGDLIPDPSIQQRIASGYNRLGMMSAEGGVQPEEYLAKYAADRVRTTASVWLGVTLGCAECHDHKFDPLSTKDFYRFAAFFSDINERGLYDGGDFGTKIDVLDPQAEPMLAALDREIKTLKTSMQSSTQLREEQRQWEADLLASEQRWNPLTVKALTASTTVETKIMPDGSVLVSGDNPDMNTYVVTVNAPVSPVKGFRIEAIPDSSLPAGGSGRASNGNFVVTELMVLRGDQAEQADVLASGEADWPVVLQQAKITLRSAAASFEQTIAGESHPDKRWSASSAIDADTGNDSFGWAVLPEVGTIQEWIAACDPTDVKKTFTFVIRQKHGGGHTLGRFRLSSTSNANPSLNPARQLPPAVVTALTIDPSARSVDQQAAIDAHYLSIAPMFAQAREQLDSLRQRREAVRKENTRSSLITVAVPPRPMRVLKRGNWMDKTGEVVEPGIPEYFGQLTTESRATRADLAAWLTDSQNPLTARVMVNRLWRLFYGSGISSVLDDFGAQGEPPTNPELLDALAVDFVASGWDIKETVKQMVMSQTYRQSSHVREDLKIIDPYNRLYARQASHRLDAEFVRDNVLATAGLLDVRVGGESAKPYQPEGLYQHLNFPPRTYVADTGEQQYRRGLYTHWQRQYLHPAMKTLDAPAREECTAKRPRSNTPLAALLMLNDPSYVEAAKVLADQLVAQFAEPQQRIEALYQRALTRQPLAEEVSVLEKLVSEHGKFFAENPQAAAEVLQIGQTKIDAGDRAVEIAAWTSVCRAVLNTHEFVTRN